MTTLDIHNPATGALLAELPADDGADRGVVGVDEGGHQPLGGGRLDGASPPWGIGVAARLRAVPGAGVGRRRFDHAQRLCLTMADTPLVPGDRVVVGCRCPH